MSKKNDQITTLNNIIHQQQTLITQLNTEIHTLTTQLHTYKHTLTSLQQYVSTAVQQVVGGESSVGGQSQTSDATQVQTYVSSQPSTAAAPPPPTNNSPHVCASPRAPSVKFQPPAIEPSPPADTNHIDTHMSSTSLPDDIAAMFDHKPRTADVTTSHAAKPATPQPQPQLMDRTESIDLTSEPGEPPLQPAQHTVENVRSPDNVQRAHEAIQEVIDETTQSQQYTHSHKRQHKNTDNEPPPPAAKRSTGVQHITQADIEEAVKQVKQIELSAPSPATEQDKISMYTQQIAVLDTLLQSHGGYNKLHALDRHEMVTELRKAQTELAVIYCNRATNYYKLHHETEAQHDINKSIELDPSHYRPHYTVASYMVQQYDSTKNKQLLIDAIDKLNTQLKKLTEPREQAKLRSKLETATTKLQAHVVAEAVPDDKLPVPVSHIKHSDDNGSGGDDVKSRSTTPTPSIPSSRTNSTGTVATTTTHQSLSSQLPVPLLADDGIKDFLGDYLFEQSKKCYAQRCINKMKLETDEQGRTVLRGVCNAAEGDQLNVHLTFDGNRIVDKSCDCLKADLTHGSDAADESKLQTPKAFDENTLYRPADVCQHMGALLLVLQYRQQQQHGAGTLDVSNTDDGDEKHLYVTPERRLTAEQKRKIVELRQQLQSNSTKTQLAAMLKLNDVSVSGNKPDQIERVVNGMVRGVPGVCPRCREFKEKNAWVKYQPKLIWLGSGVYGCKGFFDMTKKHITPCGFTAPAAKVEMHKWRNSNG